MKRILIISGDLVDSNMGGVGVRYWEIAHALAKHCSVTLAVPHQTDLQSDQVTLVAFDLEHGDIHKLAAQADALVTHGFVLHFHPYLKDLGIPLAVDLYVPHLLESLVWHVDDKLEEWIPAYEEYLRIQLELLRAGDFFFCASETQRDYWLGWLHAQKRINPHTYAQDPTLRKLIDVVPFGLPAQPPHHQKQVLKGVHPQIHPDDRLILWSGGLFDWLDPLTLIRAIALLVPRHPEIKLHFMGTTHPNPVMSDVSMPDRAIRLSKELGLYEKHIFFGQWVPYKERENFLLEADLAVLSHPEHIETRFSFRTRLLDCIWAGLPIVATQGGILSDWVRQYNLGLVVPSGDAQSMAAAIEDLLERIKRDAFLPMFSTLRETLQWDYVIQPLSAFCQNPERAVDQGKYLTELERISRDKDRYIQSIIKDKDAYIEQIIRDKDIYIDQIIRDKDSYIETIIRDKEAFIEQMSIDWETHLQQVLHDQSQIFQATIAEKDVKLSQVTQLLEQYKNSLKSRVSMENNRNKMRYPLVSVIVLNFNGAHFLPTCLDALHEQTYPADRLEVIVTDNGSTDNSIPLLKEKYPWVRLLENGKNLGFSLANNAAARIATGDYVILLNNDTAPEAMWVEKMVEAAESDPKIGIVAGHLRLFYDQLELEFETETFTLSHDPRQFGIMVHDVDTGVYRGVTQYLKGFYWREVQPSGISWRWMQSKARLGVPVPPGEGNWIIRLVLNSGRTDGSLVPLRVFLDGQLIADWNVPPDGPVTYELEMPSKTRLLAKPVQQNAGSIVYKNGAGRDRGTYVLNDEVFYETDNGQYNKMEEVFAACGASYLMRREMFEQVGLLDEDFFIYYEDTDLSWRARLAGWKIVYAPEALVRHIHCGTNKEWSPFFILLTERNRIAMIFKNGTWSQILQVWGEFYWRVLKLSASYLRSILFNKPQLRQNIGPLRVYVKIAFNLIGWLPSLLAKRWRIQRSAKITSDKIAIWFAK